MARLSATVLLLVCLFAFSHAKVPLDLPEDDVTNKEDPSVTLAESDVKNTILLPSEKPESEPATVVEITEPENESNSTPDSEDLPKIEEEEVPKVEEEEVEAKRPLTFVTYHSVNHRFLDRPFIGRHRFPYRPFFLGRHHRCRHHHHHRHQPGEISYGNDMILSEESDEIHHHYHHHQPREMAYGNDMILSEGSDEIHHHHHHHHQPREMPFGGNGMMFADRDGGPPNVPMRWARFHRIGGMPSFGFNGEEGMMMRKHFHHGEDEEERRGGFGKRFGHEDDEEEKSEHVEKEGGVMMRFRKFLNRF